MNKTESRSIEGEFYVSPVSETVVERIRRQTEHLVQESRIVLSRIADSIEQEKRGQFPIRKETASKSEYVKHSR